MATRIVVIRAFMTCVQNKVSALAQTEGSSGAQIIAPTRWDQTLSLLHGFVRQRREIFSLWGLAVIYGRVHSVFFLEMRFTANPRIKKEWYQKGKRKQNPKKTKYSSWNKALMWPLLKGNTYQVSCDQYVLFTNTPVRLFIGLNKAAFTISR